MIFTQHIHTLVDVMEEMGTPFYEKSKDLSRFYTRDIIDQAVISPLCQAEEIIQRHNKTDRLQGR